jgi:hypothetical protein
MVRSGHDQAGSIVDTEPLRAFVTRAVGRHRERAATADTPSGTTPTSAPVNPNTTTPRNHRNCNALRALPVPVTGDTA